MQSPKTVLLHLDGSARTAERDKLARQVAEDFEAEVTGQPCTLSALLRYPCALEGAAEAVAIMQSLDMGADLPVMGCYGHSRAREWVLGGATRSLLRSMTLPLLMSH